MHQSDGGPLHRNLDELGILHEANHEEPWIMAMDCASPAQAALWRLHTTKRLFFHDLTAAEVDRMVELMERYRDRPMD